MSLFMQAFLVAVFVTVAFIDSHTTQTHIFRPVVVGPVVGLIMGDVKTGFAVGVTVELMFLAVIFVGRYRQTRPSALPLPLGLLSWAVAERNWQLQRPFQFLLSDRWLRHSRILSSTYFSCIA